MGNDAPSISMVSNQGKRAESGASSVPTVPDDQGGKSTSCQCSCTCSDAVDRHQASATLELRFAREVLPRAAVVVNRAIEDLRTKMEVRIVRRQETAESANSGVGTTPRAPPPPEPVGRSLLDGTGDRSALSSAQSVAEDGGVQGAGN